MLDIHAHILPMVDDGAVDEAMAVEMLKAARRAGIDRIIATPHVGKGHGVERYLDSFTRMCGRAEKHDIQLIPGCELGVSVLVGREITPDGLSPYQIGQTRFVLLEFPDDAPPADWEYLTSDVKRAGYHAIIAHPERYRYMGLVMAQDLINYGCELQLDAMAFLGSLLSSERRTASKLLDGGLASYIASDAHRPGDYDSYQVIRRRLGDNWPTDGLLEKILQSTRS
jgi:protein-tyrosine phosphatase